MGRADAGITLVLALVLADMGMAQSNPSPGSFTIETVAGNGQTGFEGDGPVVGALFDQPVSVAVDSAGNIFVADSQNNRVRKISGQSITTVAGNGTPGQGCDNQAITTVPFTGAGTSAHLHSPGGVAADSSGKIYIADTDNFCVRQLTNTTITTYAGSGIITGANGNGDSGPAIKAFLGPGSVAVDAAGHVFIADTAHALVREVINGTIMTVAGGGQLSPLHVPAVNARLGSPSAIAVDASGNLYIVDSGAQLVLKVSGGQIFPVAGGGNAADENIAATSARIFPAGVAIDSAGNLYISDSAPCRIREVVNGMITTIAGPQGQSSGCGFSGDNGPATGALLNQPMGLAFDSSGNLYVADTGNQRIRKLTPVPSGPGNCTYSLSAPSDNIGSAQTFDGFAITTQDGCPWAATTSAEWITGLPLSGVGGDTVSFAVSANTGSIPRTAAITVAGQTFTLTQGTSQSSPNPTQFIISTVAGSGQVGFTGDGPVSNATFNQPVSVAVDSAGNIFVADSQNNRVRKILGQSITTVAGNGMPGEGCDNQAITTVPFTGAGTSAHLHSPGGVAADSSGKIYIADTDNFCVRQLTNTTINTYAGSGIITGANGNGDSGPPIKAFLGPGSVAVDAAGHVFIADTAHALVREVINGTIVTVAGGGRLDPQNVSAVDARLEVPSAIAVDAAGNLYIVDSGAQLVLEVSGGQIFPVAGGGTASDENIPATSARIFPAGVAIDSAGNLYISDSTPCRIREVMNGMIMTIAGPLGQSSGCGYSGDNGPATGALLNQPMGLAFDSSGNLYVADTGNQRIRKLTPNAAASGACTYMLSAVSTNVPGSASSDNLTITTQDGCPWTVSTSTDWINGLPQSGMGSGTVTFQLAVNMTSQSRTGEVDVTGQSNDSMQSVNITQAGQGCGGGLFAGSQSSGCGCGLPQVGIPSPGQFLGSLYGSAGTTWKTNYTVSATDGLQLTNVIGFGRMMAVDIRVPYFTLQTTDFNYSGHCELRPDGSSPDAQNSSCTSKLVAYDSLKATYEIDNIPAGTGSCLLITQSYQFDDVLYGCEPSATVPCARLTPTVSYEYIPDDPSKSVTNITIAQRFQFAVDNPAGNTAALLKEDLAGLSLTGSDPLPAETVKNAIVNGQAGDVDNYHQHASGIITVPTPLNSAGLPGLRLLAGCPECVHIHWRWDLAPGGLDALRQFLANFGLGPSAFQFTGTGPIIPPGSTQSVQVGVLAARTGEEHPANDFPALVANPPAPLVAVCPTNPKDMTCPAGPIAFWYAGSSNQYSDQFFTHYLWFSPQAADAGFSVQPGSVTFNSATRIYSQTVTVTNINGSSVGGPVELVLDNLPIGVALLNQDGYAINGSPYVTVAGNATAVAPNAAVKVTLQFLNPLNQAITYHARTAAGGAP